jgi:hypothetical protein
MTDTKTSLEAMFPIGRPARSATHKTCTRCKGTGWWQLARKCFRCGGAGNYEKITNATRLRDALAHRVERLGLITDNEKRLAEKLAAGRPRWTWMHLPERIAKDKETLAKIEAEILALGGSL